MTPERVRFGSKKNGYHAGASPQEIVIPLAVFVPTGVTIDGWQEAAPEIPEWWDRSEKALVEKAPPKRRITPARTSPKLGEQGRLFQTAEEEAAAAVAVVTTPKWIEKLLTSEQMAAQRAQAAEPTSRMIASARSSQRSTNAVGSSPELLWPRSWAFRLCESGVLSRRFVAC